MPATVEWLAAGFLLMFSSALGQTFFIAVFSDELRRAFAIGNGAFGSYYMVATLTSAVILAWIGKLADRERLRGMSVLTLGGLALTALAMAGLQAGWMLLPVIVGLRLFGQGLLCHIAVTAMARWFDHNRGKAIAIAAMGNPASQAVFPAIALVLIQAIGWRMTWVVGAAFIIGVSVPLTLLLLRREPGTVIRRSAAGGTARPTGGRHWTRAEVLRDPGFYLLMPGILAPPFVATGIFFQQVAIVQAKGWSLGWFVGWFGLNAAATIVAAFATGWVVDRVGSMRVLPFCLFPLAIGAGLLALITDPIVVPVFMLLGGIAMGSSSTLLGSLWAELYGTRHLGAIRSLVASGTVLASALAPGLMGVLLDQGVGITAQLAGMAVYTGLAAIMLGLLAPGLGRRAALRLQPELRD